MGYANDTTLQAAGRLVLLGSINVIGLWFMELSIISALSLMDALIDTSHISVGCMAYPAV